MSRACVLIALLFSLLCSVPLLAEQDDTTQHDQQAQDKSASSAREAEESSSKDTRIDLSPPKDDAKSHPNSAASMDDESTPADVQELQPWDPHKAAKDVEVGDFYFKRKNYRAALERYKEALVYKPNDAVANFRLGECEEKTGNPEQAAAHYEAYLKILPEGPFSADARKALARLKPVSSKEAPSK